MKLLQFISALQLRLEREGFPQEQAPKDEEAPQKAPQEAPQEAERRGLLAQRILVRKSLR